MVNKTLNKPYSRPWYPEVWDMRVSGAIWGPVWRVSWEVILRSILGQFWVNSGSIWDPYLEEPHRTLHLAVGRALGLNMMEYEGPGGAWVGTRYSPPGTTQLPYPGYTPSRPTAHFMLPLVLVPRSKSGRGAQIRPSTLFK